MVLLSAAQTIVAETADAYVTDVLAAQNITDDSVGGFRPASMVGIASDGRDLATLLAQPTITTKAALASGVAEARAMASGWATLEMILSTQVADAGRVSVSVAAATRPTITSYVRMLNPPSCSRCVVLAGSYSWSAPFRRHPRCDCVSIPTSEDTRRDFRTSPRDYFNSLSRAEQDKAFTKSGAQAIRDGADIARTVNARRKAAGLSGAQPGIRARLRRGPTGLYTTAELSGRRVRLMPDSIYALAGGDRNLAIRLLRQHSYIT